MSADNLYLTSAQFYDLAPVSERFEDLPFFLETAASAGGKLLELACGTGRLAIPLAEAGHQVHGLDLSTPMLDVFRRKLESLPVEIASRVTLHHGDMTRFELGRQFGLIFIAFRSFQGLVSRDAQLACLAAVRRHLAPDGIFIVNVFKPRGPMDQSWCAPLQHDWTITDPATGALVSRSHVRRAIDSTAQIIEVDLHFEVSLGDEIWPRLVDPLRLSYFFPGQLDGLLAESGFHVEACFGDYDRRPVDQGSEQIYLCRHDHH